MKYKFRAEMPQILHWAVQGCIMWQNEGLEPPAVVEAATQAYKAEMDLLATFVDDCIVIDYGAAGLPANQLYAVYTAWAQANKEYVMTSRKFFTEIARKLPDKKRVASGMVYQGARLTDGAQRDFARKQYRIEDFTV